MPRYRVTNRITKETFEVEAPYAQDACEKVGWLIGDCYVQQLRETPFTDITAPPRSVEEREDRLHALEKRVERLEERLREMNAALENVYFRG